MACGCRVIFDTTFEVDGTLRSKGGNQYRPKMLCFTLEEVRDGRPHRCGEAKLNLAARPAVHVVGCCSLHQESKQANFEWRR